MRIKILFLLLFATILLGSCFSERANSVGMYKNRYSLEIPDKWKKNKKLLESLTALLPQAITELRGKDFCLDCDAAYRVKFKLSDVEYAARQGNISVFRFRSAFDVYNHDGVPVVTFVVVDPDKEESVFYDATGQPGGVILSRNLALAATQPLNVLRPATTVPISERSVNGMQGFDKSQQVTYNNFLRCTEKKIYEISAQLKSE